MNTLIIYYSEYNDNTKKIAEVFTECLDAEMIYAKNNNEIKIDNYDLIGFGSGVYDQNLHPVIFHILENFNLKGKNVFVFSTSAAGINMFNNKLVEKLTNKGAIVKRSFSCKGFYSNNFLKLFGGTAKGHPNNEDFLKAEIFARNIKNNIAVEIV